MKKKHRDIVVDGVKYGWIALYSNVRIFKNKVVIGTYTIPDRHDIIPSLVAALIKDPIDALLYLNAEPCPFCGGLIGKATGSLEKKFFVCKHEDDCWLLPATSSNLISKSEIDSWNKRH